MIGPRRMGCDALINTASCGIPQRSADSRRASSTICASRPARRGRQRHALDTVVKDTGRTCTDRGSSSEKPCVAAGHFHADLRK